MRQLVLTFAALLCCMSLWAASSPIKLKARIKYEDKRELVPEVTMEQTTGNVLVFSSAGLYDAIVSIIDETGAVVCTESFSVHPEQPYTMMLPLLDEGEYTVVCVVGDIELYGEFSIE